METGFPSPRSTGGPPAGKPPAGRPSCGIASTPRPPGRRGLRRRLALAALPVMASSALAQEA
ncbi:MAG: hypothetical protein ACC662_00150, partial [Planctomycetota bacterium]